MNLVMIDMSGGSLLSECRGQSMSNHRHRVFVLDVTEPPIFSHGEKSSFVVVVPS
jgi:hypothetical protein